MNNIAVSGGFDPIHPGHVSMIRHAAQYGDVVVILNTDEWLVRKKGYAFQSYRARWEIMWALRHVSDVVKADDEDGTVCGTLGKIRPTYFANGGDRGLDNTPEVDLCRELGIQVLWNVGGGKIESSSELVRRANENIHRV